MATSNSYDFALTRNDIIKAALRKLNVIDQFSEPTAAEVQDAAQALNLLCKRWQAQGLHLWKYEEIVLLLEKNKNLYSLSPSGSNACLESDLVTTVTSASQTSGANNITLNDINNIAVNDNVFIELSDGSSQTTTIASIAVNTITLNDLLVSNVDEGATIFIYTNKIQKPMRVTDARRRINVNNNDVPVELLARRDWFDLSTKTSAGKVTQIYYNPKINSGNLRVWQTTDDVTDTLRMTVEYPIQDFDNITDNPDFPIEWGDALIFNLAVVLSPEYGVFGEEIQVIKSLADEYKGELLDFDQEDTYIQFSPNMNGEY